LCAKTSRFVRSAGKLGRVKWPRRLSFVLLASAACSRNKVEEPRLETTAPRAQTSAWLRYERPAPERLVAIGDLHGDLDVTRRALRLAGAIDDKDAWVGGKLVVVQTGDEIDRADGDRDVLDLFERLKTESKKTGGDVIAESGNHELMNAAGDFRYVTPGALTAFRDVVPPEAAGPRLIAFDQSSRGRAAAFLPGGPYAKLIAERPVIAKVGDTVFLHGGVLPKHVQYGIDRINDEVRDWLLGRRGECPSIVRSEDGPIWTRIYSAAPGKEECATLHEVLASMGAKRMVVGHTVQRAGINSACNDEVWRIDTGLSQHFGGKFEVLEIQSGVVKVLRLDADASSL